MGAYPIGIVGESFENDDGSSRQDEIARCKIGEPVKLERDPKNKYDKSCVKVLSARGVQIGNISRDDGWICERMDKGGFVDARVLSVGKGKRGQGVIICVRTIEDDEWLNDSGDNAEASPQPANGSIADVVKGCGSLLLLYLIVWFVVQMIAG